MCTNFAHQVINSALDLHGIVGGRETGIIVQNAADEPAVAVAKRCQRSNLIVSLMERVIILGIAGRLDTVENCKLRRIRDADLLTHMSKRGVAEHKNRGAEPLRKVECTDDLGVGLCDRRGNERDNRMIAMRSPTGLHEVTLRGESGGALAGTLTHDINQHTGDLRGHAVAKILLHQRDARTGGRCHRFCTGCGSADDCRDRGELILHLHILAAALWQQFRGKLSNFCRGGNGVAGKEVHASGQSTKRAGLVARQDLIFFCHNYTPSTRIAKSGQRSSQSLHRMQLSASDTMGLPS